MGRDVIKYGSRIAGLTVFILLLFGNSDIYIIYLYTRKFVKMENSCPNNPTFNVGLLEDIVPCIPDFSSSGDEELRNMSTDMTPRIDKESIHKHNTCP